MNINYFDFNPINNISQVTQTTWDRDENNDLQTTLIDQKAQEVLRNLKDHGIEANLNPCEKGLSRVSISREAIDQLIAFQKSLGKAAPLDVMPLIKATKKKSLSNEDRQQILTALREIRENENLGVQELMKRSDLEHFEKTIQTVYGKCVDSGYGVGDAIRYFNMIFRTGTTIEGICNDVLLTIATAKTEREENGLRIYEELSETSPDARKIEALLAAGADVKMGVANYNGQTPLHKAAEKRGYSEIEQVMQSLIKEGANVNQADNNGESPLHAAACHGDAAIIQFLINAGADAKKTDYKGRTPLHGVSFGDKAAAIQALIKAGADVNQADKNGETPLHSAARYGDAAIIQALIDAGADVKKTDKKGRTPLHVASLEDRDFSHADFN